MLTFIKGEAGCGKTQYIYSKATTASGDRILFVPDQFIFETEKMIAEMSGEKSDGLKIYGFSSLSEEILKKYMPRKSYADNAAKLIVMMDAVKKLQPSLKYYGSAAFRSSFVPMCLEVASTLKSSGISGEALFAATEKTEGSLKDKLSDLALIYSAYNAQLTAIYDDRQDNLVLAADAAYENDYFAGYSIFIDGFDSFSGSQLRFLEPMIRQSNDTFVSLCMSENDYSCFKIQEKTASQLSAIAEKENSEISDIVLSDARRYKNDDLLWLRNELPKDAQQVFPGDCNNIKLSYAPDVTTECDYVCSEIKKLTRKGIRYNEMTVLSASPAIYADSMQSAALRYDIPLFADIPSAISEKPLLKYLGFLLAAADNPTGENVLRYIKSGFVRIKTENGTKPLSLKQIYEFDRYCMYWDIKHRNFTKPFPHTENENSKELDKLREAIVNPLVKLKKACKDCDGKTLTKHLTAFLFKEADIKSAIQGKCQDYTTRELRYDKVLTEEYNQLWGYVSQLLTSCYNTMENMPITLSEYAGVFSMCASKTSLSKPPQVLDSVLFGDTRRTKSAKAKVVFIMGADIANFPKSKDSDYPVFTEKEYTSLCENGIDLRHSNSEKFAQSLSETYKVLTLAEEKLFLSWKGNMDNCCDNAAVLTNIFKDIEICDISKLSAEFFCESLASARKQLAKATFTSDKSGTLTAALKEAEDTEYLKLWKTATGKVSDNSEIHNIGDIAPLIFAGHTLSPTAIDDLNSCRFRYFCKYGLRLRTPATTQMNSINYGNIVHYILNYAFEKLYADGKNRKFSENELSELISKALEDYRNEFLMAQDEHTAKFNLIYNSISSLSLKLLTYMTGEIANSKFVPHYFELELADGKETSDGMKAQPFEFSVTGADGKTHTVKIKGTVDRVDIADTVRGKELRVIDYKTGDKSFDLHKVYYGLDLQLLLYLFTLCENNPEYSPSSATYYPKATDQPLDKTSDPSDELKRGLWLSNHSETGIAVTGTQATEEMQNYDAVTLNKSGSIKCGNLFAATKVTPENLEKLKNRVEKIVKENMEKVLCGNVNAIPLCDNTKDISCINCNYRNVCGKKANNSISISNEEAKAFKAEISDVSEVNTEEDE